MRPKFKRTRSKKSRTLREKVQKISDTTDQSSYQQVAPFLAKTFGDLTLEKIDLSSQESASQALGVLQKQMEKLEEATRRTRALKAFLESQRIK